MRPVERCGVFSIFLIMLCIVGVLPGISVFLWKDYMHRKHFIDNLNKNECFISNSNVSISILSHNGKYKQNFQIEGDIFYNDNDIDYKYRKILKTTTNQNEVDGYIKYYDNLEITCFTKKYFSFLDKPNQLNSSLAGAISLVVIGFILGMILVGIFMSSLSTIHI